VAAFGAFVDVGVHQDGLVHVSAMSRTFVSDPRTVVKSGDVVRVKVLSVDVPRHRISLTLRLDDEAPAAAGGQASTAPAGGPDRIEDRPGRPSGNFGRTGRGSSGRPGSSNPRSQQAQGEGAMADALRRAGLDPSNPKGPAHR